MQNAVSHEVLSAQLVALRAQLDEHVGRAAENREDVREIRRQLENGQTYFADIKSNLASINVTLSHVVAIQNRHGEDIDALQVRENIRQGQTGVLAAILSSRPVLFLGGLVTTIAAFLFQKGDLN